MKENEIRPDNLYEEADRLSAEDTAEMARRYQEFVFVPCPACESMAARPEFEKSGFNFVRCLDCETLFINPRPTAEMLNRYYQNSKAVKFWNLKVFPQSEKARREKIFVPRAERVVELCRRHGAEMNTLLDVGAGFGSFCEEVKRLGEFQRVIAVEPSSGLAETCRGKGLEVVEAPIEEVVIKDVGVIVSFEVIEHLFQPKDFLLACAAALPPGGLLIFTTPNLKGFDIGTLGRHSENVTGPNHLNYFHPASLELLLRKCGFAVLEVLTPGTLDAELVRKKAEEGVIDLSGQPFLKRVLLDDWVTLGAPFQEFLASNCLSSHLWIVARRITP